MQGLPDDRDKMIGAGTPFPCTTVVIYYSRCFTLSVRLMMAALLMVPGLS